MSRRATRLLLSVGAGGVGKTTLSSALGIAAARQGLDVLVMTFDPSHRLKDALGVGGSAAETPVDVALSGAPAGRLRVSLLDARRTFDRLVALYSPDAGSRDRILGNRYYAHLAGGLSGILEYMAVERLFEVVEEGEHDLVVLDTPPTRQALDFLEAPDRILAFLDSGALRLALRPWFDARGRLKATARIPILGGRIEAYLDEILGLDLLRDMAEFFQAFAPLYAGFRERATEVRSLLAAANTRFLLVASPAIDSAPDALFFARKLQEKGHYLAALVVNRVHPEPSATAPRGEPGVELLRWLADRDAEGVESLRGLLGGKLPLIQIPLLAYEPSGLAALEDLGREVARNLPETIWR